MLSVYRLHQNTNSRTALSPIALAVTPIRQQRARKETRVGSRDPALGARKKQVFPQTQAALPTGASSPYQNLHLHMITN